MIIASNLRLQQYNHPISSILSYKSQVESLETGLQTLSRIMDVAFPSEERATLSRKLFGTRQDVSRLSENAAEYAGYLTITHVFAWISYYATQIREEVSRIFKGFQQYSASIVKALPFWEFLPYDKHYEEHGMSSHTTLFIMLTASAVNNAVENLLGRRLNLRCAHFLAAFRCLKDSDCQPAFRIGYFINSNSLSSQT
jgi:hypothetical protein